MFLNGVSTTNSLIHCLLSGIKAETSDKHISKLKEKKDDLNGLTARETRGNLNFWNLCKLTLKVVAGLLCWIVPQTVSVFLLTQCVLGFK